ncbi:MAG TPA: adenylate/guanylate cyclase domain-containing protein [Chromatiales bacterium]|nr:adenylate/guanylate cyclase domain-containing protein [Thiotrichales bacterium]HIP68995.1 adenylate/guanylate cyclase domain-containing protein [Chromatiales bacterium]
MNTPQPENVTVMFADVVGSTRIYEVLGDAEAQYTITHALNVVGGIVQRHKGSVVKSAGDDVLSAFQSADDALTAACVIHDTFAENRIFEDLSLEFHIGIHSGMGIFTKGDIYGDAVNVAARLTSTAKSGQILTSKETVDQLTNGLAAQAREFDTIPVKGRKEPVQMYDIIWKHTGDETSLMEVASGVFGGKLLRLQFKGQTVNVLPEPQTFILGRGIDSGLVVSGTMVSRQHASIEYRRDKFVLRDLSTNGTYVRLNGEDFFIKREETTITGDGIISLGKRVEDQPELNIQFQCI